MSLPPESQGLTLTVLGCGTSPILPSSTPLPRTMGIAILGGVMSTLASHHMRSHLPSPSPSGTSTPALEPPERLPGKFVACDSRREAEKQVKSALGHYNFPLTTLTNQNVTGARKADVVLLACKPQGFKDILGEEGMREALAGKLLVSILAGVTASQIEGFLYPGEDTSVEGKRCRVVRVMPNTASFVRESMSVIQTCTPPLSDTHLRLVTWIFSSIGRTVSLPASAMDASTALCGSGPAFFALMLEAVADGAVAMGLPRAEAQMMAAQTMRGTTGLVLNGEHPAMLRDKVSTPGGCTIGGLLVLEEGTVRGTIAKAVREATVVANIKDSLKMWLESCAYPVPDLSHRYYNTHISLSNPWDVHPVSPARQVQQEGAFQPLTHNSPTPLSNL
ncbi:pyrroline-5-carboxylate reductase [Lindgomyces ingoldianus]|uniref:Pyrroline-5-carboxylate reductase n=1 Tax=Lindgomyces ingoldianus TaxID=673940 RepID=A0ACB6QI55_9PLEO|nr:pyrroline-5-carboxylate reductase [Lindgomyces ingoldianus]KAF2465787.1 pyrroline-5-carboxylate reductase [Lindgomyces ingoldianus]